MSSEKTTCDQFIQHAWKKDICTNCSKHLSCHSKEASAQGTVPKAKTKIISDSKQATNSEASRISDDGTKSSVHSSARPDKPKKPVFSSGSSGAKGGTGVVQTKEGGTPSRKLVPVQTAKSSTSNYYDIYDVAAKGQSGKPIELNSSDDEQLETENELDHASSCMMATPYTVVDVITSALEKSRQSANAIPPQLPTTPAPDMNKRFQATSKKDIKNIKKEEHKSKDERKIDDKEIEDFNSLSPKHYRPRLYEEIDDLFLEKVATKKLELKSESEASNSKNDELLKENDKPVLDTKNAAIKTVDVLSNKSSDTAPKGAAAKHEKHKKSGGKSFFQKLLGKGSKDDEMSKSKCDKKESAVDEKSLSIDEDAKKSSETLPSDGPTNRDSETHAEQVYENAPVSDGVHGASFISDDFAKEIEEKFETLTRRNNFSKTEAKPLSSNKSEPLINEMTCENSLQTLPSRSTELISSSDESSLTLPTRKPRLLSSPGSKKPEYPTNRKSMTPSEAKLARKMLVAPPPPPTSSISSTLTSSVMHIQSRDDVSTSSSSEQPQSFFMSLQRKPVRQSSNDDAFEAPHVMPKDSLMDDLEEIFKKGGMGPVLPSSCSNTLPKSLIVSQDKTFGKVSMTTGRLPSSSVSPTSKQATSENTVKTSVQQRALPDLPQLPPPTARLHKTSLSPDSENLYEVLPNVDEKSVVTGSSVEATSLSDATKPGKFSISSPIKVVDLCDATSNHKFKSNQNHQPERPRPAPRAAIRSVNISKPLRKDLISSPKGTEESYANSDVSSKSSDNLIDSLRIEESLEDKFIAASKLTHQSLQIFLEKFCSPSPFLSYLSGSMSDIVWKSLEADIIKIAESKSSSLTWMKAVFYEITLSGGTSFVLMVRRSSVISSPFPSYNHANLICSLYTFEATANLSDCRNFFQTVEKAPLCKEKINYIFDVLPYSLVLMLSSFTFPMQITSDEIPCSGSQDNNDVAKRRSSSISKQKVYVLLQIIDSLLHLQRLGVDLSRLHANEVLLVRPLQGHGFTKLPASISDLKSFYFSILVPTEYDEHSPMNDQKLLCRDLAKLASLIIDADKSPTHASDEETITCGKNGTKSGTCQQNSAKQVPQPRARQTSITLDKNDRCLRKVERIFSSGNSWTQVEEARTYLELSLWGPASEEEIKAALVSPQRKELFTHWLDIGRAQMLVELLQTLALPKHVSSKSQKSLKEPASVKVRPDFSKSISDTSVGSNFKLTSFSECYTIMETIRRAEFLSKCEIEELLDASKGLFF